jgi:hypothetical protein
VREDVAGVIDYIFGYGSLAGGELTALGFVPSRVRRPEGFVADLAGMRRGWGVAMDNRLDRPGYKHYVDGEGRRPQVFVCFLDVREAPGVRVNGVCLPVATAQLPALDLRERNYERIDVSSRLGTAPAPGARVWAYQGSEAGRARFREGVATGSAVIHDGYLAGVRAAFRTLGVQEWEACAPSLDPDGLPVAGLTRRDLP